MFRHLFFPGLGAAFLCAAVTVSRTGTAATDEEKAGARAAAVEGARAFSEKRWGDTVDLFSRAEAMVHSPVHLLFIARADVELGKLVLAREAYMKASRERVEPDMPPAFQRAHDQAGDELKALEPRLPYVTLKVEGVPLQSVVVTMDGVKVPTPLIGLPRPVDPGEHKFEAGEGFVGDPVVVAVAEAERKTATLTLQVAATPVIVAAPAATPVGAGAAPAAGSDGGAQEPAKGGPNGLRIASYAALGVGVVGLGMGTVFGLKAGSDRTKANDLCKNDCPESKRGEIASFDNSANSASTVAKVGFVLGGVGIGAGVTLFFLSSGKKTEPAPQASVQPWVGLGSAGVAGRF